MNKDEPLHLIMPRGCTFGWGVCGKYLALELSKFKALRYVCEPFGEEDIGDRRQFEILSGLWRSKDFYKKSGPKEGEVVLDGAAIQAIEGQSLKPIMMNVRSPLKIGYTFFETPFLRSDDVARANDYYDMVVGGSTWCRNILAENGVKNTGSIMQGIDTDLFNTDPAEKDLFKDRFVVFSGGKFELRKGQDLVIRAFKVLQDRHDDVVLVNCWYNQWHGSLVTMAASPYIGFVKPNGNYFKFINQLLQKNGVDHEKVVTLPPTPQAEMPNVFRSTDCGLFPNRCEGGTNLVLMEYMACGKPAIASYSSGHRDILKTDNCLPLTSLKDFKIMGADGSLVSRWDDPDLDEIVDKLEWAYQNRDRIRKIGNSAGESMRDITWQRAADQFVKLLED